MSHPRASLVAEAATRLCGRVVRTPLLEADTLNRLVSDTLKIPRLRVFVKAENLQHTGAFKYRGATNKLLQLSEAAKKKGVVAFSSGNFAQALALASREVGVNCTIVSPHDAPPLKLARTKRYGARVVTTVPENGQNREVCAAAMAERIAADTGATLLHPFDDWDVIYGQGTLGLEVFEQANCEINSLVIPTGGGGMLAGCVLAAELRSPRTRVYAVEPEWYNDHCNSFRSPNRERMTVGGHQNGLEEQPKTVCDALQANSPGKLTWSVNKNSIAGALEESDKNAVDAMKIAFTELKIVLEPSAALGLAALLNGKVDGLTEGSAVAVVACGGNVSLENFIQYLSS